MGLPDTATARFETYNIPRSSPLNTTTSPVCLVTGGSSGVGLATAVRFARAGYRIQICGRNAERLESARLTISNAGGPGPVQAVVADLADAGAPHEVVAATRQLFGRIDVLVNNAAMAPLAPLDHMDDAAIQQTIDLNIRGVYLMSRAVWRVMKEQGSGVIVNISSQAALDPFPGFSLYGSCKAWIELLTLALAREGRDAGIRVYGVRPGAVETPMLRSLFAGFPADQAVSPAEVAEVVWLVCQTEMKNSSGQVINVSRQ